MHENTPYVVDNRWIVHATSTMEAAMKYQAECNPDKWPTVRQATPADAARLPALPAAGHRKAA